MANVVTSQQQVNNQQMLVCSVHGQRDWNSGLFSCFEDCGSCLMTYFCICCSLCDISKRTGECMCMPWFVPGGLIALRARIRTLGGIQGSICGDCVALSFCGACAVCQMQREINTMGL